MGAAAVFVSPFLPQKQPFLEFLPGNNYPDAPFVGGMKFATQISPLLNLKERKNPQKTSGTLFMG